ncbi:MAG TPA: hypothetical protein PKV84_04270 [Candidatus Omnitrophota bacterium]|nr:hypothetical protein [Candidatus Omnitrophota bacterium]
MELLLALSILSSVLIAGGVLSISVAKILYRANAQTRAFDTVNSVIRFMEKDIKQMVPGTVGVYNQLCSNARGTSAGTLTGYGPMFGWRLALLDFQSSLPLSKTGSNNCGWWGLSERYGYCYNVISSRAGGFDGYISNYASDVAVVPYIQKEDFKTPVSDEDFLACRDNPCYKTQHDSPATFCPNIWDIETDSEGNQTLILRIGAIVTKDGKTLARAGVRKYFALPKVKT